VRFAEATVIKTLKVQQMIAYCRCKRVLCIFMEMWKSAMQWQPCWFAEQFTAFMQSCIERKRSQTTSKMLGQSKA